MWHPIWLRGHVRYAAHKSIVRSTIYLVEVYPGWGSKYFWEYLFWTCRGAEFSKIQICHFSKTSRKKKNVFAWIDKMKKCKNPNKRFSSIWPWIHVLHFKTHRMTPHTLWFDVDLGGQNCQNVKTVIDKTTCPSLFSSNHPLHSHITLCADSIQQNNIDIECGTICHHPFGEDGTSCINSVHDTCTFHHMLTLIHCNWEKVYWINVAYMRDVCGERGGLCAINKEGGSKKEMWCKRTFVVTHWPERISLGNQYVTRYYYGSNSRRLIRRVMYTVGSTTLTAKPKLTNWHFSGWQVHLHAQ